MSSKLIIHMINEMPHTKNVPCGPAPDLTPQPPPPHNSDLEPDYGNPDETCLLTSIPTSTVTLKSLPRRSREQQQQWQQQLSTMS